MNQILAGILGVLVGIGFLVVVRGVFRFFSKVNLWRERIVGMYDTVYKYHDERMYAIIRENQSIQDRVYRLEKALPK